MGRDVLFKVVLILFSICSLVGDVPKVLAIDMEGIAPTGNFTTEINSTRTFGIFDLIVPYGHFFDAEQPGFEHPGLTIHRTGL